MNTSVSFGAMPAPGEDAPYPRLAGMMSSRRPPAFMPTTPSSQPLMTWPFPSVKLNGWPSHDDWIVLPDE